MLKLSAREVVREYMETAGARVEATTIQLPSTILGNAITMLVTRALIHIAIYG